MNHLAFAADDLDDIAARRAAVARPRLRRRRDRPRLVHARSTRTTPTARSSSGASPPARSPPPTATRRCAALADPRRRRVEAPPSPTFFKASAAVCTVRRGDRRAPALPRVLARPGRRPRRSRPGGKPSRVVSPDGAIVRGMLWTPPAGTPWRTRGRAVASPWRLQRALRLPAARRRRLRGARVRDPLRQQRHRLPAREVRGRRGDRGRRSCASGAPRPSCCSATAAAAR